jgi:signal transduction histidine kinase/ligand-binding sensor domain-containing protein
MLTVLSAPAFALDPALDISQYAHTAWKIRDGFFTSHVGSFAQTQDGYLWLGTEAGLFRFDGVRFRPWQPPPGASLPDNRVRPLLVSRDGTLWIGTAGGLASWNGHELRTYPQLNGDLVNGLIEDREGTLWVGAYLPPTTGLLCAVRNGSADCRGADGSFGATVLCLYEDKKGTLWFVGSNGLWRWKPGPPKFYSLPDPPSGGLCLNETATGTLLVATAGGVRQLVDGKFEPFGAATQGVPIRSLFRDRDGAIWIGTRNGLLHAHGDRVDAFRRADGLSGDEVGRIFEDREGSIWVETEDGGMDRFRPLPAVTYSMGQGLRGFVGTVLAGKDGSTWITTTEGLYRWRDGRLSLYRSRGSSPASASPASIQPEAVNEVLIEGLPKPGVTSLFEDRSGRLWLGSMSGLGYLENGHFVSVSGLSSAYIDSIAEDKQGTLWVVHRTAGLLRVSADLKVQQVPWPDSRMDGWRIAIDPADQGLWIGYTVGGLVHVVDGVARASYSVADGLGKGKVYDVRVAADGTVWAGTDGGLSRIRAGRIATLNISNGLPCDLVIASIEDSEDSLWIDTACGLVRIARADLEAWIAAADEGKTLPSVRMTVLDDGNGVHGNPAGSTASPRLAIARDGRVWFPAVDGVTSVDPRHTYSNTLPPPVHVEQVVADRKPYDPSGPLALPPQVRDLTIDYTALSLVAPEKMLFRYKLEGRDRDWEDAGNRRQAFYTDLPPGNYRFRVIAANNSGVWNEEGASLAFSIAPAYWQTNWFLALSAVALLVLFWGLYQLRVRQFARAQAIEKRHRQMEMELAHANRLATMGQLTASIAHEVNQPLGATITNAQAALRWLRAKEPDMGEVSQALEQVVKAGNRAADVVARVRRLAKKAPAPEADVDVNAEILEIVAIIHDEALKHSVWVKTELASNLSAIKADPVELQQVLLNLTVNAIQAMSSVPDGKRELTIRSEADGGGGVVVSVMDTGPGLAPDAFERIFQPFYTSKEGGLGMGLSICRTIIESHGGKLWAVANSPRGAVFQFMLPHTRPF